MFDNLKVRQESLILDILNNAKMRPLRWTVKLLYIKELGVKLERRQQNQINLIN